MTDYPEYDDPGEDPFECGCDASELLNDLLDAAQSAHSRLVERGDGEVAEILARAIRRAGALPLQPQPVATPHPTAPCVAGGACSREATTVCPRCGTASCLVHVGPRDCATCYLTRKEDLPALLATMAAKGAVDANA